MEEEGIHVGATFKTFIDLEKALCLYEQTNFVQLYKRDSRTIEAYAKRVPGRDILGKVNRELRYAELDICCIHGGANRKSRATGQRPNQSSFQQKCPMKIKIRLSTDLQELEVKAINAQHNHVVTLDSYKHLPRQRRLDDDTTKEAVSLLKVKANKKLVQEHFQQKTGKVILLKDLHNIKAKNLDQALPNDLQQLVEEMLKEDGATVEVVTDENNELQAIYYQDQKMKSFQSLYPELLLLDATYKLNDLRMPLFLLLVVDGNGESQPVGLWLVTNEERSTVESLMDTFIQHNKADDIECVMADKDMVERQVVSEKLPNAALLICLYHVMRTFNREITCGKMGIKSQERTAALEHLQKIAYSKDEEQYQHLYSNLKELGLDSVNKYYDANWHNIRGEWVVGLMNQHTNLMHRTNNRVESINQKLKAVITTHSKLIPFWQGVKTALASLETERKSRAMAIIQKVPYHNFSTDSPEFKYWQVLTPYAFEYIQKQLALSRKDEESPDDTTTQSCSCGFRRSMKLPCSHMFRMRASAGHDLFDAQLVAERWTKTYFLNSYKMFCSIEENIDSSQASESTSDTFPSGASNVQTTQVTRPTRILSQQQRYKTASQVALRLASLASEATGDQFQQRLLLLRDLEERWSSGRTYTITHSEVIQPVEDPSLNISSLSATLQTLPGDVLDAVLGESPNQDNNATLFCSNSSLLPSKPDAVQPPAFEGSTSGSFLLDLADIANSQPYIQPSDAYEHLPSSFTTRASSSTAANLPVVTTVDVPAMVASSASSSTAATTPAKLPEETIVDVPATVASNASSSTAATTPAKLPEETIVDVPATVASNASSSTAATTPAKLPEETIVDVPAMVASNASSSTAATCTTPAKLPVETIVAPSTPSSSRAPTVVVTPAGGLKVRFDLSNIKMPPRTPKRGRPKGSESTVIGLPKKKRRISGKPMAFRKRTEDQQKSMVLGWMIGVDRAAEVLSSKKKAKKSDLLPIGQLTVKLIDENVPVEALIRKLFSDGAWKAAEILLTTLRQVNHECEVCNIADLTERRSIQCDCCLNWYNFSCAGLDKVPSRLYWFCRPCYN